MAVHQALRARGRNLSYRHNTITATGTLCGAAIAAMLTSAYPVQAQTVQPQPAATAAAPATAPSAKAKAKSAAKAGPGVEGGEQAAAKKDPNEAQTHVDNGIRLLQGGKIDSAVHTFSSVIGAGKLPPTIMARALYNRGLAYRKQGKPAQAISDLTSALWLKGGLNDAERADALASRVAAYREAGLSDQSNSESATAAADNKVSATRSKTADQAGKPLTTQSIGAQAAAPAAALVQDAPQAQPSSSGIGGLFGSLFSGGASPAPAASAPAAAPAPAVSASTVATSATASAAVVQKVPAPSAKSVTVASATAAIPAAAAPKAAEAKFRAQVAVVKSRAEADAAAKKIKEKYASTLGTSELVIDQTTLGNMGTFFRVRIGPYLSQLEAQAVCANLKGSGLDCVPVVQ
jgi:tetratricopeptide (TPR) repeat protein